MSSTSDSRMVTTCRMCGSGNLEVFLDLGMHPPSDAFLRAEDFAAEKRYPLQVALCMDCGLSQLTCVVAPEILYQRDYPYEGSQTQAALRHWRSFAADIFGGSPLGPDDLVVDIGSNVGTLLHAFQEKDLRVLGIEPAANIARIANLAGIETWSEFFGLGVAEKAVAHHGLAKLVTATNVFAHIDDLEGFMVALDVLLAPGGRFVFEAPYFPELVAGMEYDTIYHEHLSYLSARPLALFFARHGYAIEWFRFNNIHGGSFRVCVGREGVVAHPAILPDEAECQSLRALREFGARVALHRRSLQDLLWTLKRGGKRIAALSAPAKGMTLLNYCGIGTETLDFATEKSALKIGKFTPGGHIPVLSDEALLIQQPDYALVLAWNFGAEIMRNNTEYAERGGQFIIPIPSPIVVDHAAAKIGAIVGA